MPNLYVIMSDMPQYNLIDNHDIHDMMIDELSYHDIHDMMKKVEEYRELAERCRKLALSQSSEKNRRIIMEIAETWEAMAVAREEQIKGKKEYNNSLQEIKKG